MKAMLKTMVAIVACIIMLAPAGVSAAGTEYIGGSAGSGWYLYSTIRVIGDPDAPGPAVAFRQDAGIVGLQLGAWDCSTTGIVFGFNDQVIGSVRTVADGLGAGQTFCMMDRSTGSTGAWNGLLFWD